MSSFPISISWQVQTPPTASFEQLAKSAQSLDQAMAASAGNFDKFGQTVSQLESPLSGVSGSMGQLEGSMSGLEGSLGSAAGSMGEFAGSTQELNDSISETGGFVTDAAGGMGELASGASESGSSMTELGGATGEFNGVISETGGFVTETGTAMGELSTSTGETGTAMGELNTTTGETNTAFGELNPLVTETQTGFAEMVPVVEETGTGMTDLTTATDETNTALETSVDALGNVVPGLQDTATGAADSAQGFTDLAPPIEDTNTALDSSTGLLEGVSPLLADTGTNAGTAAGTTEEFSGALGGLNGELGPVNGGLTTENTLLGDVGGTAKTTSGETAGLTGSMSQLGFGIAGVVGSAFSVVGAFQNLRNAQFRVDAANRIVEVSSGKLDKALFAMNKTINKLATDSEGPVSGLNRLVAAQKALNDLIDAGVKSGPQFTAALDELRAAQDALGTSTSKDAEAAAKLAFQITGVSTASQKLAIDGNKLTKTLEGQAEAFGNIIAPVVGLTGIAGSLIQTFTGAKAAFGALTGAGALLKGAFVDIGIVASQSVIPALGAIAVPAAIAVAAIGAFIGVVTAIRANLKVFDELGVKVGEVFPEMKTFLEDARQGFINLSDGINSAISFILGGIDSFAGGTTNMKAQWEGFTGTLPQGTGEMGFAGEAVGSLGVAFADAANKVKIGNGAWKDMGGTLVAFSGNVTVAEGSWRRLDDQTVEYVKTANQGKAGFEALTGAVTENATAVETAGAAVKTHLTRYSEMTTAQKLNAISLNEVIQSLSDEKLERFNAIKAAENYLVAHGTTAEAVGLSGDVLIGYVAALQTEAPAYSKSVQEASQYLATKHKEIDLRGKSEDWIIKTAAALQEEDKALAKVTDTTAKHVQELQKLQTTLQENAAELVFYAEASNLAGRMQLEFSIGLQEAELKLNDQEAALSRNNGTLQGNLQLLQEGRLQEVAYAEGVYEANNAIVTKTQALAKASGEYNRTNELMKEGKLQALAYAAGLLETKNAIQDTTLELIKLVGQQEAYGDAATAAEAINNELISGYLEHRQSLIDLALEYANNAGAIAGLRQELADAGSEMLRFNSGVMEGRRSALEFLAGLAQAKGEARGFRDELVDAAKKIPGAMQDMSSQSIEQIQRFIEVAQGIPSAFEDVANGLGGFTEKVVSALGQAGEEGKDAFMENIEAMEKELGAQFSEPLTRDLQLAVDIDKAKRDVETGLGILGAAIAAQPLTASFDNSRVLEAIRIIEQSYAGLPASSQAAFAPLQASLDQLKAWDPGTGITGLAPIMANILSGAENLGGPLQGLIGQFGQIPAIANASATELEVLKGAFASVGLSLDTLTGQVTDANGNVVGNIKSMSTESQDPLTQLANSILGSGEAATQAQIQWATEIQAMKNLIAAFVVDAASLLGNLSIAFQGMAAFSAQALTGLAANIATFQNSYLTPLTKNAQSSAITISGAFNNMATNVNTSLVTAARGITTTQGIITNFVRAAQSAATTVSGAFSNMASNTTASMNKMASGIQIILAAFPAMGSRAQSMASQVSSAFSKVASSASQAESAVRRLKSAIDSLQSKTVTITTIYRQVIQRVYAAQGGAFVSSSPTKVGPLNVSEFGQKELITVTPLENPSGQTITGPGMQVSTSGPNAKAFAKSGDKSISLGGGGNEGNTRDLAKKIADFLEEKISSSKRVESGKRVLQAVQPQVIILKVSERELTRIINRNLFEVSDAIY